MDSKDPYLLRRNVEEEGAEEEEGFVASLLRSVEERISKGTASKVVTEKWGEVVPGQWIGVQEFSKILHDRVEPEFRHEVNTIVRLSSHLHLHRMKRVCFNCWLPNGRCMCDAFKMVRPTLGDIHLHLYMNESEILRSANTGKLLLHAMGSSHSKLYISCLDDDENALRSVLQRPNAMVLFPSEDSIGVDEFLSHHSISTKQPADIVILDSTWSGARYLRRRLENMGIPVPFVCLSEATMKKFMEEGSPLSVMKKTRKDGMCTMEAFALLLSEMGKWEEISSDLTSLADELQKHYFIESGKRMKRVDPDSWDKSDVRRRDGRVKQSQKTVN
eukprot:TRINITY_DN6303_c0_g1_i1.p1 TRINITY_DN6303_c0_g1~~TRINITY_DN6303_c0_g1_i1.p1  ORF type:complete len:352 (+),score=90.53 TRINITY_DN6303_c0_g1_i1:66-1058(+)